MNAASFTWRRLLLLLGVSLVAAQAEETLHPDDAPVRAAVARSLDFLIREGDAWMNERDCISCHHMPELIWSHREAKRRGVAFDQKKFDEFQAWSAERAKNKAGIEGTAFLMLAQPGQRTPELVKLIVDAQQADGSWKPGGQFASMQRRDLPEATENSARIFLLALGTQAEAQPATETARVRAAKLLDSSEPPKSLETLVFRLLYAQRFGPPEKAVELRAEILKSQRPDGGWAWMIGEQQSDPLATGEALYAVQQLPDASAKAGIARARRWLLERQREDGGWAIDITRISKIDRSGPAKSKSFQEGTAIYTFWGTAWATLSLLEGLPVIAPAP